MRYHLLTAWVLHADGGVNPPLHRHSKPGAYSRRGTPSRAPTNLVAPPPRFATPSPFRKRLVVSSPTVTGGAHEESLSTNETSVCFFGSNGGCSGSRGGVNAQS